MADNQHIISIILNARDNTSAAIASATAKLKALEEATREQRQSNEKLTQSFEDMRDGLAGGNSEIDKLSKSMRAQEKVSKDATQSIINLEQASKRLAETEADASRSTAQRLKAQYDVVEAEQKLREELIKTKGLGDQRIKQITEEAKAYGERTVALKEGARVEAEANRERQRQMRVEAEQHKQRMQYAREEQQERDRIKRSREQEIDDELARLARRDRAYDEFDRKRAAEDKAREQRQRELNRILDQSDREAAQRRERDLREIQDKERRDQAAARARDQRRQKELNLGREYLQQLEQIKRLEDQRKQASDRGDTVQKIRVEVDADKAKADAAKTAAEINAILEKNATVNVELDGAGAVAHAAEVRAGLQAILGKDIKFKVEADVDNLNTSLARARSNIDDTGRRMSFFTGLLGTMTKSFHESSGSVASFDNYLRGLTSLGIAAFLNQIILLAGAAAGGLLALASSAATAGAALGGALAAGAAQAIGPLGLLVTAITRVSAVMDVVKQANLLQQQQSYQGADSARRIATATDQVTGANDRLAQANKRVGEAQKGVNRARQEAIDKLKELILQERGASLSLEDSQKAIAAAVRRGDTAALPGAFLRRDEARANLTDVRGQISARRTGVAPEVQQAKQQLDAAQQSAKEAGRSLEGAKRSAQDASTDVTAAAGKLNYLMGQLSDAERGLYSAILRLQDVWREFAQTVSEPLIVGFTGAINKVIGLLQDQAIVKAATNLSTEMSKQFTRVFDAFTSPAFIDQFLRITEQARVNLKPIADIVINLGSAFFDLAEAAGPALSEVLDWLKGITDEIAEFFDSGRKSGDLQKFFEFGVDNLKEWGDLLWQIIRLFAAVAGPGGGAASGLQIITALSDAIGGLADKINDPKSDAAKWLQNFFDLSRRMLGALSPILSALAEEFRKTFTEDGLHSVEGFVFFISDILIPAIGDFVRAIGDATAEIGEFLKAHEDVAKFTSALIAFAASMSIILRIGSFFSPLAKTFFYIAEQAGALAGSMGAASGAAGPLTAALRILAGGAIITFFVLLLDYSGKLDDIWRQLKESAGDIFREVKPAVDDLIESVEELIKAFGEGDGLFGIIKPLGAFIGDVLIEVIKTLADYIGRLVRGLVRALDGVVTLITGLITLDFDKVIDGFRKIGRGLFDVFTAPFRAVGRTFIRLLSRAFDAIRDWVSEANWRRIGRDILDGIVDGLQALGRLMIRGFRIAVDVLEEFVTGALAARLGRIGLNMVEAIAQGIRDAPSSIVDALADKIPGGKSTLENIAGNTPGIGPLLKFGIQATGKNKGGPIPGVGDTDTVPAMLTPGEHVLTKGEVQAAGGHGVIFMLRALLGGGGQGSGGRYKAGGAVGGGPGSSNVAIDFEANLEDFGEQWKDTWQTLTAVAKRQSKNIAESMSDMYRFFRRTLADMQESAAVRTADIAKTFRKSFGNVSEAVYDSLRYVGKQTNNALAAFDANPVKFSISRPPGGDKRAATGYIGQPGERGRDAVPIWVGRGEAVLNWAQQKAVNARLAVTGSSLNDVFNSNKAYHAGGAGDAIGYAEGGYTGPGHSGAGFTPVWNMAQSKFGMSNFTGFDGHSYYTTSGNVSDHTMHRALDMSNGVLTPQEDALSAFFKTKVPQVVKQLIWRNKDQFKGFPVGGHEDHVHLAMLDQYAFNGPLMAKILSRALRGLSISALLKGASGGTDDVFDVDHVDPVKIISKSKMLGGFIEKIANKVRRAANKYLDKQAMKAGGGSDAGGLHGEPYDGPLNRSFPKHSLADAPGHVQLSPKQVNMLATKAGLPGTPFEQIAHGESNYYPGIIGDDAAAGYGNTFGYGLWQITPLVHGPAAWAEYARIVGANNPEEMKGPHPGFFNPWFNALMARYLYKGAGSSLSPWFGTDYLGAQYKATGGYAGLDHLPRFDVGGRIPTAAVKGAGIPIMAHEGEWVLNRTQQSKLANAMGSTTTAIKRMLGFGGPSGDKSHFDTGGEVAYQQFRADQASARAIAAAAEAIAKAMARTFEKGVAGRLPRNSADRIKTAREKGTYEDPESAAIGLEAINREINLVYLAIRNITSKEGKPGKAINKFLDNVRALTDEDGLLDQAGTAIELVSDRMTTSLELAKAGFRRVRGSLRLRRRDPLTNEARIASRELDIAQTQQDALLDTRQDTRKGLVQLNDRLRRYRRDSRADGGGISEKERQNIDQMIAARVAFRNKLDTIDSNIAAAAQAVREARLNRFNARTERQLRPTDRQGGWLDVVGRIYGSRGDDAGALAVGQAQVTNMAAQQRVLQGRLAAAQAKARRNPAWAAVARDLEQQIWDLSASIAEQVRANFEAGINIINTGFERRNVGNEVWGRIGSALGNTQIVRQTQVNTRALMQQQVTALSAQLPRLAAAGQQDLYYQVAAQIGDLQAGIVEITAQIFNSILEDFDKQITRARAAEARSGRLNDLRERAGDRLGAAGNRLGQSDWRLSLLRAEQQGLTQLRANAAAQGNVGAVEELTERLAELTVAIEEENATRQDLVYAYRNTATDIITGRVGRSTGLIGSAQSLIERLGTISGTQTVDQVKALIKQSGDQLRAAATEIANNVNAGAGEFGSAGGNILNDLAAAFRAGPNSFATKLAQLAPAIAALETTMGDTQRAAFQSLIQSMLDNTTAIVDNTGQLQQINGVSTQSFSSSLWTTLRMALFNGNGMPLFNYLPHFATGGVMGWDGPAYLHAGEIVTNPRLGQTVPGGEEHNHIHLHNVEKDVDIGHAFEVIEFKRSQRRAT